MRFRRVRQSQAYGGWVKICLCVQDILKCVRLTYSSLSLVTIDGARTAQFEHTVLVTEYGADILTA